MLQSQPEPKSRQPRASRLTSRQGVRLNSTLSRDASAGLQILREATVGNIPAVRKLARQLRKSGKGVEEALAAVASCGPLHMAAWAGRLEMCKFLVDELRLNVNAPGDIDTCEIAELLLSRGADVDPISVQGTPLHFAAQEKNAGMLELLLKYQANAGADLNAGRPATTPLIIAAACGSTCCIKCLLEAGADPNIPDEFGRTAAEIAAIQGQTDCVEILSSLTSPPGTDVPLPNANDGCALKEQGDVAFEENDVFALKIQGDAAFKGNDYADALALYTKAMDIDPDDATLYAKRSICWLHMSEEDKVLDDAYTYRTMKMDLSNSCCEQAAALILVEEYAPACRALVSALKLDLRSDDLD